MEEKYKIHAFYILGILLAVIVILITVQWSGIPNLAEKISFALTLASLILAALAIAYAVYSNTSFSQNISALNNASREISTTSKNISDAAQDLVQKIEVIPHRLESVEGRVAETNILIRQFSQKPDSPPPTPAEKLAINEVAEYFLNSVGPGGLFAIYFCSIAYEKNKSVNLKELCDGLMFFEYKYALGMLVILHGTALIRATEKNNEWLIVELNEKFRDISRLDIKKEILERFAASKLDTKEFRELITEELKTVDNFWLRSNLTCDAI